MPYAIELKDLSKVGKRVVEVERYPDECPICHHAMQPTVMDGVFCEIPSESGLRYDVQIVCRCTRYECACIFVCYYHKISGGHVYSLRKMLPSVPREESFSPIIKFVSDNFCKMYNQASLAEQYGLDAVCGTAYRKALEFLIKDFVIGDKGEDEKQKIGAMFLGKCISSHISNANIKEVAKRAAWLGNDETHYMRIWTDKDVQDLKRLINLVVHWIEAEELTKEAIREMPDKNVT